MKIYQAYSEATVLASIKQNFFQRSRPRSWGIFLLMFHRCRCLTCAMLGRGVGGGLGKGRWARAGPR